MKRIVFLIGILLLAVDLSAQEQGPFSGPVGSEGCTAIHRDSSAIVAWATGVIVDRGPQNISYPDSPLASFGDDETIVLGPASTYTTDAVSLGDGGSATLTFAKPICNGMGPDFAVFENGMKNNQNGGYFLELAFVEVSSDGERFVRFPATSLTQDTVQQGPFANTEPTMINNLAGKHIVGYGTPFDLDELKDSAGLDVNAVTHVRVIDVVGCVDSLYATYDAYGHKVNDPWPTNFPSSGFDLTGVAVLHQAGEGIGDVATSQIIVWPNPAANILTVRLGYDCNQSGVVLYDATGRPVLSSSFVGGQATLEVGSLPIGVYMLRVGSVVKKVVKR